MLSHFIAHKIYAGKGDNKNVSRPAVLVATAGMAIGLAVMIISVCVILGFKHTIRDKIIGFGSHATVTNATTSRQFDAYPICASDSLQNVLKVAPGVSHVQTYTLKQGILKTDADFMGVVLKGVDEQWDSAFIAANIKAGSLSGFSKEKSSNTLVVSKHIADKLYLKVGDKIFAYFVGDDESLRTRRFTISAIYETNLSKFDDVVCFTDIYTTRKLNGWEDDQVSGYELSLSNFDNLDATADYLIRNVNKHTDKYGETYTTATVKESNPQIFSWLDLLDMNVWIILALMVCVAAVTMTSGLLIIILERVQMIGILKALGARNGVIRHTFLWLAGYIIMKSVIIGDIIGIGICLIQKYTGIVTLDPSTYYVSEAPVEINIPIIILLNIFAITTCTLVLIAPTFLVSHISPVKSIRFGE